MHPIIGSLTLRQILYYLAIALTSLAILGYTIFQARFLLQGPVVTFLNEPDAVQTERLVYLEGTAKNIVHMYLNGRQVFTDKEGYFREAVVLENGYTVTTLEAHDRYGRTERYTYEFVYAPVTEE